MSSPFRTVSNRSSEDLCSQYEEAERLDSSPHLLGRQKSPPSNSRQQYPLDTTRTAATVGWTSPPVSAKFQAPKRNISPPLLSTNVPVGVSYPADMNSEREMQAKAKRLARFHVELNQPAENPSVFSKKSFLGSENNQVEPNKVKFPFSDSTKKTGDSFDGGALSDYEAPAVEERTMAHLYNRLEALEININERFDSLDHRLDEMYLTNSQYYDAHSHMLQEILGYLRPRSDEPPPQ